MLMPPRIVVSRISSLRGLSIRSTQRSGSCSGSAVGSGVGVGFASGVGEGRGDGCAIPGAALSRVSDTTITFFIRPFSIPCRSRANPPLTESKYIPKTNMPISANRLDVRTAPPPHPTVYAPSRREYACPREGERKRNSPGWRTIFYNLSRMYKNGRYTLHLFERCVKIQTIEYIARTIALSTPLRGESYGK